MDQCLEIGQARQASFAGWLQQTEWVTYISKVLIFKIQIADVGKQFSEEHFIYPKSRFQGLLTDDQQPECEFQKCSMWEALKHTLSIL